MKREMDTPDKLSLDSKYAQICNFSWQKPRLYFLSNGNSS